jgi:hypothetical protein
MEFCSKAEYNELIELTNNSSFGLNFFLLNIKEKLEIASQNTTAKTTIAYIHDLIGTSISTITKFGQFTKGNRERTIDMILNDKQIDESDDLTPTLLLELGKLEDTLIEQEAILTRYKIRMGNTSHVDVHSIEHDNVIRLITESKQSRNVEFFVKGEKDVLKGSSIQRWMFTPESTFDLEAEQIHFRIAESQFQRFLATQGNVSYNLTQIEYIVNPDIVRKFKESKTRLAKRHGFLEESMKPIYMFHGTSEVNMENIIKTNFLISKVGSTTDQGFYGRGIYFSEYPSMSISYSRGNPWLLLCAVYVGKAFKMMNVEVGCALKEGYDSHCAFSGQEVIIFDTDCILPCYKIKWTTNTWKKREIGPEP